MSKRIAVFCEQYFTYSGDDHLHGGGERYFFDVVALLKSLQYDVSVFQFSYKPFSKRFKQLSIKGIGNIENPMHPLDSWQKGYEEFKRISEDYDGVFLLSQNMAVQKYNKPTLTINHGVIFDSLDPNTTKPMRDVYNNMDSFRQSCKNPDKIISVDSNAVKLSHVICREYSPKFEFIVNYVDLELFKPTEPNKEYFDIIFPRRLQFCRAYQTMMKATDYIIDKYPQVRVFFVGKGNEMETNHFMDWFKDKPKDKVFYDSYEMQDMYKAYQGKSLSCIPTINSEGSSLSALESLASGIPCVATVVGGLQDVCMGNVNSYVINPDYSRSYDNPNASELIGAIERAINNPDELATFRQNAITMIKAFDKKIWESKVSKVITSVYGNPNE